jgi:hypothetical protein
VCNSSFSTSPEKDKKLYVKLLTEVYGKTTLQVALKDKFSSFLKKKFISKQTRERKNPF